MYYLPYRRFCLFIGGFRLFLASASCVRAYVHFAGSAWLHEICFPVEISHSGRVRETTPDIFHQVTESALYGLYHTLSCQDCRHQPDSADLLPWARHIEL